MNTPPKTVQDFVAVGWPFTMAEYKALEAERDALREAIASALTSLATGPAKDGYAYAVLNAVMERPE